MPSLTRWLQVRMVPLATGKPGKTGLGSPSPCPNQLLQGPLSLQGRPSCRPCRGLHPCLQLCMQAGQASPLSSRWPRQANPFSGGKAIGGVQLEIRPGKYCSVIPATHTPHLDALGGSGKDLPSLRETKGIPPFGVWGGDKEPLTSLWGWHFHQATPGPKPWESILHPTRDISGNPAVSPAGPEQH